jgi:catechol 2,3-dioxygenase-like lactoylglutathione lyase family enzyme
MLRRTFLALALLLVGGLSASDRALVTGVDSVGLTVSDLDRSVEFYSKVLSFQKVSEVEVDGPAYEQLHGIFGVRAKIARMRLGDEFLELTEFLAPRGRPAPVDARSNDRWFQHVAIIVKDMDRAYRWLRENKVQHASSGPQRLPDWNKNAAGIQAFYFRDPDGHPLEILSFPPWKGDPKWQRSTEPMFLGIDHTAIVINDTQASLKFYRDALGMHVVGESENYGPEQERLNNVFGARLRITAVRGPFGPGVEFLEYLAPQDGRPYPPDARSNDLAHWQTNFSGTSVDEAARRLRKERVTFVSVGAQHSKSVIVRDPDGHAIQIAEPLDESPTTKGEMK